MQREWTKRKLLGISLLTVLVFCAPFFKMEYATDSYTIARVGLPAFGAMMYQHGRVVSAQAFYLVDALGGGLRAFYYASYLLAIPFAALAIFLLTRVMRRWIDSPRAAFLLSFLTVLNPLSIEYFLFIEKGYFMLAICMSVLALYAFVRALEGRWLWLPLSYLCVTVAAFTYQTLPGTFAVLAVPMACLCAKGIGTLLRNLSLAVSVYGVGAILNYLFLKLEGGSARAGSGICFSNISPVFLFAGPILTPLLFALAFVLLFLLCAWRCRVRGQSLLRNRAAWRLFLHSALTVAGGLAVTFLPLVLVEPSQVWFPCRIIYPIGTLLGTLPLLFLQAKKCDTPFGTVIVRPNAGKRLCAVLSVLLALNFAFFWVMMLGRLRNNRLDEELCQTIGAYIEDYEAASGNEVLYVSIYHDASIRKSNPLVLKMGDSNVRAFSKDWSDVDHMNVLLERNFAETAPNQDVWATHFAQKNWDAFHPDQLVFDGNTLHLCVY